ncbi:peptidase [Paroceanicella profunda]|uniref:Peptidase n=1 Tax=Paroceanicella profunda TaxID=2579971 RepID=A0A5B8FZH9_9RHOB|nr:NlpC/P60 family protein [Paroceanicella profunda]QDL93074.1 peptidase [Paroceanicella profunda]
MTADRSTAEAALEIARGWIGTPYVHQASCRGAGTDCLGLLRGVWRELYGCEPEPVPAYTPDWSEPSGDERMLAAAARHMLRVAHDARLPGDVLVFRMRARAVAKHIGILGARDGAPTVIHAYSGHAVTESPLGPAWDARIAAVFRFPD